MTTPRLHPLAGLLVLLLASAATAVLLVPPAHAARPRPQRCDVSGVDWRLGAVTITSLKVTAVRCGRGVAVVRAFHGCRLANGPTGRCVRLVKGYACQEQRTSLPTQINGLVTCRKDRKTVAHRYTQAL